MTGPKKQIQHDEVVKAFGNRLRQFRLSRGMTQDQLANAAEVTTAYVGRLERGRAAPGIDLVARLAKALGTSSAKLLDAEENPTPATVLRTQAKRHFEALLKSDDEAILSLIAQFLARLAESSAG